MNETGPVPHPLLALLLAAAQGEFPPADGRAVVLPALGEGRQAVVCFTAHTVLATHRTEAELARLRLDGYGAALQPKTLSYLAAPDARVGEVDVTMVGSEPAPHPQGLRWNHARTCATTRGPATRPICGARFECGVTSADW